MTTGGLAGLRRAPETRLTPQTPGPRGRQAEAQVRRKSKGDPGGFALGRQGIQLDGEF